MRKDCTAHDTAPISNYRHILIKYVIVSATCVISLLGQLLLDALSSKLQLAHELRRCKPVTPRT